LLVVSVIVATNTHLVDLVRGMIGIFKREPEVAQDLKVNDPTADLLKVNDNSGPANALPVRGQLDVSSRKTKEDEEHEALPAAADEAWVAPALELLSAASTKADAGDVKANAGIIQQTLESFGIGVQMAEVNVGPTVTQYTFTPPAGVKLNKI